MQTEATEALDRVPDDFMQRPYEILKKYRDAGPIHHVVFPHGAKVWLVTRYDDVRMLLSDPRVSKDGSRMNEMFARHSGMEVPEDEEVSVGFDQELSQHMLNSDPPRHTRLRGLVSKAFTLRRMEAFRPRIEQLVDELLDGLEGKGEIDLVADYAQPLPIIIICDLLGIPFKDREMFQRWAVELVGAGHDPAVVEAASQNVVAYANGVIDDKRDHPEDDMVSALVQGAGEGNDRLTQAEIVAMIFLFTVAGHITSQHTLSNGLLSLLTHPDQLEKLRSDLSIMPAAIDELMRFDGGVGVATFRFTKEEIPVGDVVIPAGEILALSILSAHRDDSRFPDADDLDLDRRPNGVLGFGHGTHFCIGQPLAKIQTEVALRKLITRFPQLRLLAEPGELQWEDSTLLRGLLRLPASVAPLDGQAPQ
ncbi:MAG TPA: cytochrome P450 [Kribbella sp.]|nr:cytochrome P450 [Kribbella sp.]